MTLANGWLRRFLMSVGLLVPALALAQGQPQKQSSQQKPQAAAQRSPGQMMDVEELNDNISRYAGKKVTVAGEIEDKLDARSFVIESGGIFDDEIVVLTPPGSKGLRPLQLNEDADIVVTGTVRSYPVMELERELGWDLDPELEVELEGTRNYLVADNIRYQNQ